MVASSRPLEFNSNVRVVKNHARLVQQITLEIPKQGQPYIYRVEKGNFTFQSIRKAMRFQDKRIMTKQEELSIIIEPNIHFKVGPVAVQNVTQKSYTTSWALDRDDQPSLPLDNQFNRYAKYSCQGQHIYIVDTGIYFHGTFIIPPSYDYSSYPTSGYQNSDGNGHGTFCACLASNPLYGICSLAQLHSIQVLDETGSGYLDDVVAGLNWILYNGIHPSVISMSLGSPSSSQSLNTVIAALINKGSLVIVAAGNEGTDACTSYPAGTPGTIAVGATDNQDMRTYYSNYGSCVKGYGPGHQVMSCDRTLNGVTIMSGTSMVPPQYAGVAAIILDQKNQGKYIPSVKNTLLTLFQSTLNMQELQMLYLNYAVFDQMNFPPPPPPPPPSQPQPQPPFLQPNNIKSSSSRHTFSILMSVCLMILI